MSAYLAKRIIADQRSQESLVAAMMESTFYPKPPDRVTHRETHISHLFFAGTLVYKIKKAVRYDFLDFSTLARRRYYLQEELRLNRRLAPSVYLGVMPIAFDGSGWRLGGWTEPAEYVLVMRRLPEKRMLPFLLETKQVTAAMMRKLAELLAEFHRSAERVQHIESEAYFSALADQWNGNLKDLELVVRDSADREQLEAIRIFGTRFLRDHRGLLARRAVEGWVRDVHGDLHAEHVCFAPEGIQIFDCIEFNPTLRRCDLASEIAFLLMDLSVRGGETLREPFMTRYSELMIGPEAQYLLPFFECYRALVRAKVHALRLGKWNDEAARYFRFAVSSTWKPFMPFLVLVCGLTGSGKSILSRALGERLEMPVINSDTVRKAIVGTAERRTELFNQGIYSPAMTDRTYAKMAREAEKQILIGKGAILDATFSLRNHREKISRLAAKHGVPIFWVRCFASEELTYKRLAARAAEGRDASDGRWEIYLKQKTAYEPPGEVSSTPCLPLDTNLPLEELERAVERFLRSRLI
jgi:aminoglycoside phosphotransferase family enzyme/predicted kinase